MKRFSLLAITLIVFAMVSSFSFSCSPVGYSGTVRELTIGSSHNEADTLIYIADEKDFFAANGLNVTIKNYSSGAAAVEGMLKGEVDIATASEFIIVQNAFRQQTITTIGAIGKNYSTQLVGRTDRGIRSITDLKDKKVGIPGQTLALFQFWRFLDLNGMNIKQMTIVNIDIAQSVNVLVNADVDAVQTWEPYVSTIKENLGDKIAVWPSHSGQPQFKNLTVTHMWLVQYPDMVKRVLKSLAQAESFIALYPDQVKTIIRKRLQYSNEYVASVWPLNQFSLSLDQSLIVAMEDEARWMIKNDLTTEKQVPDFLKHIYIDGMMNIKPQAVNIIR